LAGIEISGLNRRSNRVLLPLSPSLALRWNAMFDVAPRFELLVVHGTVLLPTP